MSSAYQFLIPCANGFSRAKRGTEHLYSSLAICILFLRPFFPLPLIRFYADDAEEACTRCATIGRKMHATSDTVEWTQKLDATERETFVRLVQLDCVASMELYRRQCAQFSRRETKIAPATSFSCTADFRFATRKQRSRKQQQQHVSSTQCTLTQGEKASMRCRSQCRLMDTYKPYRRVATTCVAMANHSLIGKFYKLNGFTSIQATAIVS